MNFKPKSFTSGKVVYYVDGKRFENSKDQRDGKAKAEQYCYDNFINPSSIQKFDSRLECDYYEYLIKLENQGCISELNHHYVIKVVDGFVNSNGDTIPPITYEADFVYKENGQIRVIDVKGSEYFLDERFLTLKSVFDLKFKDRGIYIRVIMRKDNEWVEWHIGEKKKSQKLINKQRAEIKQLRQEKHDKEKEEKLKAREVARLNELLSLDHLTSSQKKRLNVLKEKYAK